MKKILLLFDYAQEYDRRLLRGLVRYSNENGPWAMYRLPVSYSAEFGDEAIVRWAKEWKADAIIGKWNGEHLDVLRNLNIPVIIQNYHHRSTEFPNISGNYIGTGRMAAEFFINRGFRNFGFYGLANVVWSTERLIGFGNTLRSIGVEVDSLMVSDKENLTSDKLVKWLKNLPKPAAVLACDDSYALAVAETCRFNGISIPDDIALMGIDNDDLLCNISDPPITSIDLNVEKGGYAMGRLLHQLMDNPNCVGEIANIVINPGRIVLRRSTDTYDIHNPHIAKVVYYIESHFKEDFSIDNLMSFVPMSRRNLEMKFRAETHLSIYQFLLKTRCSHLANMLANSDAPLSALAENCGFKDSTNVSRVFKKFYGCSPKVFRSSQIE